MTSPVNIFGAMMRTVFATIDTGVPLSTQLIDEAYLALRSIWDGVSLVGRMRDNGLFLGVESDASLVTGWMTEDDGTRCHDASSIVG